MESEKQQLHQTQMLRMQFFEMAKWIDSDISYVNQILQNSEYYLIEDRKREHQQKMQQELEEQRKEVALQIELALKEEQDQKERERK